MAVSLLALNRLLHCPLTSPYWPQGHEEQEEVVLELQQQLRESLETAGMYRREAGNTREELSKVQLSLEEVGLGGPEGGIQLIFHRVGEVEEILWIFTQPYQLVSNYAPTTIILTLFVMLHYKILADTVSI